VSIHNVDCSLPGTQNGASTNSAAATGTSASK